MVARVLAAARRGKERERELTPSGFLELCWAVRARPTSGLGHAPPIHSHPKKAQNKAPPLVLCVFFFVSSNKAPTLIFFKNGIFKLGT